MRVKETSSAGLVAVGYKRQVGIVAVFVTKETHASPVVFKSYHNNDSHRLRPDKLLDSLYF